MEFLLELFLQFFLEGICELVESVVPGKNISKKARKTISNVLQVYSFVSAVLFLVGIVFLVVDPKKYIWATVFIFNFILLFITIMFLKLYQKNKIKKIKSKKKTETKQIKNIPTDK